MTGKSTYRNAAGRLLALAAVVGLGIVAAGPVQATEAAVPGEGFRAELTSFVEDLATVAEMEGVGPAARGRIAEARSRIATLSPAELARIEAAFASFPEWRAMPGMVRLLAEHRDQIRELAETRAELERYRQLLEAAGAGSGDPGTVDEFAAAELRRLTDELGRIYAELAPIRAAFQEPGMRSQAAASCKTSCGADVVCWGKAVGCLIDEIDDLIEDIANFVGDAVDFFVDIGNEIAGLFTDIGNAFAGLFSGIENLLTSLFDDLLDALPTDANEILELTGLDDPDWFDSVVASLPRLEPPCPAMGSNITGIGEVGSARAEWVCKRGIDWFAAALYDLVPDDVLDVPVKIPATLVYYPINYFCLCMEGQSAISFHTAQGEHRDYVEGRLDTMLSTRATESSLTVLRADLTDLDVDVAAVETKLDLLDDKADQLKFIQGEQGDFLATFQELTVRLEVENNLLDHGDDAVGLFQLPEALGGRLREVREIVLESIAMSQAAGERVYGAVREVTKGDEDADRGDYAAAYAHYQLAYRQLVKQ